MKQPDINKEDIINKGAKEELSPEEYDKLKKDATKKLTEEIEYLKIEEEYWRLLADIEEHRTRQITMLLRRNQFYQKQKDPAETIQKDTQVKETEGQNKK